MSEQRAVDTVQQATPTHLSPAQRRLARLLRDRGAHVVALPVTGMAFSDPATASAWGKGLRRDTVDALVTAGILRVEQPWRGRQLYRLIETGDDHVDQ